MNCTFKLKLSHDSIDIRRRFKSGGWEGGRGRSTVAVDVMKLRNNCYDDDEDVLVYFLLSTFAIFLYLSLDLLWQN